jgi:thioredoxin-dependent peroxiredoxin
MFTRMQQTFTFRGDPITLVGPTLRIGDPAPEFQALGPDFAPVTFAEIGSNIRLLLTVPSLDAPNCDQVVGHFSTALKDFGEVTLLVASMDLPFTQARWLAASGMKDILLLSDYRHGSLGKAFGVLIEELRLLAQAVFIINERNRIAYSQYVREVTDTPDYAGSLSALQLVVNSPLRRPGG